jgi:hypothetical protein
MSSDSAIFFHPEQGALRLRTLTVEDVFEMPQGQFHLDPSSLTSCGSRFARLQQSEARLRIRCYASEFSLFFLRYQSAYEA